MAVVKQKANQKAHSRAHQKVPLKRPLMWLVAVGSQVATWRANQKAQETGSETNCIVSLSCSAV